MLIKKFNEDTDALPKLEALQRADGSRRKQIETEIRNMRAGFAAEKESAYYIDFELGDSRNWAVIHDLRVETAGRVAQIDHLLINRVLEIFVLESKSIHAGIKITEDGEFLRWVDWKKTYEGMASPLSQNDRHIAVLAEAIKAIELPSRLGLRLAPTFHSYVLVSPKARIDRPKKFDTSRIVKSDDFVKTMRRRLDEESVGQTLLSITKVISQETLENLGRQLAALHRPISINYRAKFGLPEASSQQLLAAAPKSALKSKAAGTHFCRHCESQNISILHGKYGYYFKCTDCGGNTPIKVSCGREGHKERIRKEGQRFFRECAECKSSALYFTNEVVTTT